MKQISKTISKYKLEENNKERVKGSVIIRKETLTYEEQ